MCTETILKTIQKTCEGKCEYFIHQSDTTNSIYCTLNGEMQQRIFVYLTISRNRIKCVLLSTTRGRRLQGCNVLSIMRYVT